eukprot:10978444-Lingulodinium_polyedra.AAC.1
MAWATTPRRPLATPVGPRGPPTQTGGDDRGAPRPALARRRPGAPCQSPACPATRSFARGTDA